MRARDEARKLGLTRFTGNVCPKHVEAAGERMTNNGTCVLCWREGRRVYQRTHRRGLRFGKVCAAHPELKGERWNDNCRECERERKRDPEYRKRHRARRDKAVHRKAIRTWRERNYERHLAGASARSAVRRARKKAATVDDSAATRRAWRKLRRDAKALGMSIDHRVPLAGCKCCGARGTRTEQLGDAAARAELAQIEPLHELLHVRTRAPGYRLGMRHVVRNVVKRTSIGAISELSH